MKIPRTTHDTAAKAQTTDTGVDLTLLRFMLALTPLERLKHMTKHAGDVAKLLEYGRQHRESAAS